MLFVNSVVRLKDLIGFSIQLVCIEINWLHILKDTIKSEVLIKIWRIKILHK